MIKKIIAKFVIVIACVTFKLYWSYVVPGGQKRWLVTNFMLIIQELGCRVLAGLFSSENI
jgi:hypothetical protein